MQSNKLDVFWASNSKLFPSSKMALVREKLEVLDDSKLLVISSVEYKEPTTMLLISLFLGVLGIDRFMLGETGTGILKLLTGGVCGILTIADWFSITNRTKEYNFKRIMEVI